MSPWQTEATHNRPIGHQNTTKFGLGHPKKQRSSKNDKHKNHVKILTSPKVLQKVLQEVAPNKREPYFCLTNRINSSLVKPASAIISSNKPRFISSCFGTGTTASSFTRIKWLPFCLATQNPAFARALTTSRQESSGSFDNYFSLFALDLTT